MNHSQRFDWSIALLAVLALITGCRASPQVRDPEFADLVDHASRAWHDPDPVAAAVMPVVQEFVGPQPVEVYVRRALEQNPDVQAARLRVEASGNRVPQAASLDDPTLGVTVFAEPVQTAAGQQELMLSASQKVPWFGKLRTRAEVAEAQVEVVRAQLAVVELATIEKVKRAYYELYFAERALNITQADRMLLLDLTNVAESKYVAGTVSYQDVLRIELELLELDNQLIRLRQQLESGQARLARLIHVSPDTPLRSMDQLPSGQIPGDLNWMYRQAIAARPELQSQLAAVERDQRAVELAALNYHPDVTYGASWIDVSSAGLSGVANGRDAFLLGASLNLPIYRKRLDAGVREAEARAVSSARVYDSLRDQTQEEIKDLFTKATSQRDLVALFHGSIIPKAEETLQVSIPAYQVGQIDFLQLIDNWRQLLRFQIAHERLQSELRQTLATLERTLGGPPIGRRM